MGCCHHNEWGLPATPDTAAGCALCDFDAFVRNHFYTGKMMGAAEFITETHYHAERMRHHNVRLHGWGVVCGLKVHQHPSPDCRTRFVVVEPGSALDCCGHEILVPAAEIVEVAAFPQVRELARDDLVHTLQLCVRWRECPTEQVPVLYDECGCDDTRCAPNRILESYDFDVLVDPVLSLSQLVGREAIAAFVASSVHGVTGAVRAADGEVLVIDPEQPTRLLRIDPARRAMQALMLPAEAAALALASDGAHVFVVLRGSGAAEAEVRVFKRADLGEVPTIAATRKLPGTTASSRLRAVAGKAGGSAAVAVLDVDSGKLHRFAHDAAHVIVDAPAAALALPANLTALTSDGDAAAFALDGTKVIAIDLAAGTSNDLTTLTAPAPLELTGLAAFGNGAQPAVAVVGTTAGQGMLWAIDIATPNAPRTQPLAHRPLFVAAAGGWLQVYEDHNGHGMVQAVELPLAATPPRVSAPRFTGGGHNEVVLLFDGGQAGALAVSALADSDCADLLWQQLEGCPDCGRPDCVVLATLAHYRPGAEMLDEKTKSQVATLTAARIDNRLGRRLLASTATLQAWLECLQLKGGVPGPVGPPGDDGDPGPGIDDVQASFVPCDQPGSAVLQVVGGVNTLVLEIPRGCDGEDGEGTPGQGIDAVTAIFVPCTQPGAAALVTIAGVRTLQLTIPRGCDGKDGKDGEGLEKDLTQIVEIGWQHDRQGNKLWPVKLLGNNPVDVFGLWVRFSAPVRALDHGSITYTPHALSVQLPSRAMPPRHKVEDRNAGLRDTPDEVCWCEAVGIAVPAKFDGNVIEEIPGPASDTWAFVFSLPSQKKAQANAQLMVRLRGDFFVDQNKRAVDAEFPRAELPSGDRPAGSPLGIQGGVFESWFWLDEALGQVPINRARRADIVALPGIGAARARQVMAMRTDQPFASFADFRGRLALSDEDAALLEPLVSFSSVER